MDLLKTEQGNQHVILFQDLFTKVFLAPDQKSIRIVRLLTVTEEIVPLFRVPEALLSDRGANLLSHLMSDPDLADPVVEDLNTDPDPA